MPAVVGAVREIAPTSFSAVTVTALVVFPPFEPWAKMP